MTSRGYTASMLIGSGIAAATLATTVLLTSPESAPLSLFVALYAALFCALAGALTVALFFLQRSVLRRESVPSRSAGPAFRQAALLSGVLTLLLALRGAGVLTWWNALLAVSAATVLELLLLPSREAERAPLDG